MKKTQTEQPIISQRFWPSGYSTDEIKTELGDFENEYTNACAGPRVHNEILGNTCEGVVNMALERQAIIHKKDFRGKDIWNATALIYPAWAKKVSGMNELRARREYAKKKNLEFLEDKAEKKEIDVMTMF